MPGRRSTARRPAAACRTPPTSPALAPQKLLLEAAHEGGRSGRAGAVIQLYARLLARYPQSQLRRAGARGGRSAEEEAAPRPRAPAYSRPGLRMPAGSNARFSSRCRRAAPASSGANAPADLSLGAKQRRMAARARRRGADRRAASASRAQPAQRAAPLDQLRARQRERRRCDGSDEAPQRRRAGEERVACARGCRARSVGLRRVACLAAELVRRRAHRGSRARQAHARARRRARRSPRSAAAGRPSGSSRRAPWPRGSSRRSVSSPRRARQHLERDFGDQAERAERAGEQARHVVAGDVLHHLAAEAERAAAAVEQLHAEHEVAHRAGARRGAGRRVRPRRSRRAWRRRRNAAARRQASGLARASVASISASGVPQRAVITSSVGS